MTATLPDFATTRLVLPPDARVLDVSELSERLRTRIGPVGTGHAVVTRPGYRVAAQLVAEPLARLINEFREPSLMTQAVLRFARAQGQDPFDTLELAFDALATLVKTRILVPQDSPDASAPVPTMGAGQAFAGFEIEALVRSLDDSEVYRARAPDGARIALKVTRDERPETAAMLAREAGVLKRLGGWDGPALLDHGTAGNRSYVAMQWCEGVPVGVAAQQARLAGDRTRLHNLVAKILEVYARLHARGVLHGDVHPGNCLLQDDGRVVLLDFGNARSIDESTGPIDLGRTGVAHFHDPMMAGALLAGRLPPTATPASEQYSIGVLAYLLLTGLHPVDAPAVTLELLERIVTRPPRPFAARGVAAWPSVERVLARALAKHPEDRFADVAWFARAFAATETSTVAWAPWSAGVQQAFDDEVKAAMRLEVGRAEPGRLAWFALRAAMTGADAELLGAADVLAAGLSSGWVDRAICAHVARVRFDSRAESEALAAFLAVAAEGPHSPAECARIMCAAGSMLRGTNLGAGRKELVRWAQQQVTQFASRPPTPEVADARAGEAALAHGALSLAASGAVVAPDRFRDRLDALAGRGDGSVWLWALAHEVYADERYETLAVGAPRPASPLPNALALLTLHQVTGDLTWIGKAREQVETAHRSGCSAVDVALLVVEASAPEHAIVPPFAFP